MKKVGILFVIIFVVMLFITPVHAQNGVVLEVWEGTTKITTRPAPLIVGHTYKFTIINTIEAKSYGSLDIHAFYGTTGKWNAISWSKDIEPGTTCTEGADHLSYSCSGAANSITSISFTGTAANTVTSETARGRIGISTENDTAVYNIS